MTWFIQIFMALVAGMCLCFPVNGYAQKNIRSAWVAQTSPAKLSPKWHKQNPARTWQFAPRPVEKKIKFPSAALTNQMVWNIPQLSVMLTRSYALAQQKHFSSKIHPLRSQVFPGKREFDAVIFDLDGTLLNSLFAWEHSGSNFVRSQGIEPETGLDEELVQMSLLDGAQLIKSRYQLAYTPEEILELTLRPIRNHYYTDIAPMPGVPETLARLHAQGVKMAVATAGDYVLAQVALKRLGLLDYFEFIITCDEVGVGKSSPIIYEEALKRLGTSKSRTLVAEDALHALQTAQTAGFPTAAVEEVHSVEQRPQKVQAATYYVFSFQGDYVFPVMD